MGNYYKNLKEYIHVLDRQGKLVTVKRQINKDLELMPLENRNYKSLFNP